jgi:simple sugar transport system ATP-binding protein
VLNWTNGEAARWGSLSAIGVKTLQTLIRTEKLSKIYPNGTFANKSIDFAVLEGEIHGLVGENGAGKTTLMKMLYGEEQPSAGQILIGEKPVSLVSEFAAIKAGIGMVHQHFMLVPSLTAAENLVLGKEPKRARTRTFDFEAAARITQELSEHYNLPVIARARVADLSVSMRQKLEILKALYRGARILILDEPTAVLTPQETEELFIELKTLKKQGKTIIFISHKLKEIFQLCDRVTVMRDGRLIAVHRVADVDVHQISNEMVGREVRFEITRPPMAPGEKVLEVRDLAFVDDFAIPKLRNVSFSLCKNEILGVVGVDGNGQSELVEIITGTQKALGGSVRAHGADITNRPPSVIRRSGIAHIAEDRMTVGTALPASIEQNVLADRYWSRQFSTKSGFLKSREMSAYSDTLIREYDIRCNSAHQPVASLSGGNMQKVVIAREFTANASILIISQPTRGVDIGAIEYIHSKIMEMRSAGKAILLVSSDLQEVMGMSDSLIVMHQGEIVAYFPDASLVTDKELGLYMLGLKRQGEDEIRKVLHE